MYSIIPERHAGLISLGVAYLWAATFFAWLDWTESEDILVSFIGFTGAALASLSGIAAILFVDGLKSEVIGLRRKIAFNEAQIKELKEQAQLAISLLEKERANNAQS